MSTTTPSLLLLNQMAGPMTWELAQDLGRAVGQVAVLTGHPDTLAKGSDACMALYPSVAYRRGNFAVRLWRWFRYSLHAFFWVWRFPAQVPILAFSNPPIVVWVCRLVRLIRGTPYAVMVHDIYPDTIVRLGAASGKNPLIRLWRFLNRGAYRRAAVVMTLGEHMAGHVKRQCDQTVKVQVVPPWADDQRISPVNKADNPFAKEHQQVDRFTVMYSGNMGRGHDIETMLAAADRLRDDHRLHFMFIGAGPKWQIVEDHLAQRSPGFDNITLLGWLDESILGQSLSTANLGMVSLEPEMTGLAVPSKAYYFLAAGVPLVALCQTPCELADTIQTFRCGCVVRPGDVDTLCEMIRNAAADESLQTWREGVAMAREEHARHRQTDHFLEILRRHLGGFDHLGSPSVQGTA